MNSRCGFARASATRHSDAEKEAIGRLEQIAWQAYSDGRKAPLTRKAGPGYADPEYELSVEWLEAKDLPGPRPK